MTGEIYKDKHQTRDSIFIHSHEHGRKLNRGLKPRWARIAAAGGVILSLVGVAGKAASSPESMPKAVHVKIDAGDNGTLWKVADNMATREDVDLRPLVDELAEQKGSSVVQPHETLDFNIPADMAKDYGIEATAEDTDSN